MTQKNAGRFLNQFNCVTIAIITLLFSPTVLSADPSAASNLQDLKANIANIREDLQQQQSNRQQLQQTLKASELNLAQLNHAQTKTQNELAQQQTALKTLAQQQAQNQINLKIQQQQLQQQIRTAYMLGQENYFKVLLNQEDPNSLSRNMVYYHYLIRSRLQLIHQINANQVQSQQNQQDIVYHKQTLADLQKQQASQIEQIKNSQASRQQSLSQINLAIRSKGERLQDLLADKQALEKVILRLDQESAKAAKSVKAVQLVAPSPIPAKNIGGIKSLATTNPVAAHPETKSSLDQQPAAIPSVFERGQTSFAQAQGKLQWPTKGKINSDFNSRIEGSELKLNGVVINAPQGQKVYAVAPGRVAFAQWMSGYGLLMIIDHGQGYMTLYGRNGSVYKKVGDTVAGGEQIAAVGDSGGYSQPGLYFAIRQQATPLDPSHWCRRG